MSWEDNQEEWEEGEEATEGNEDIDLLTELEESNQLDDYLNLNVMQRRFIVNYLTVTHLDAVQAARNAGYKRPRQSAWRLKHALGPIIARRIRALIITPEECLMRISLQSAGTMPTMRRMVKGPKGDTETEEYNTLAALDLAARVHKMHGEVKVEMDIRLLTLVENCIPTEEGREQFRTAIKAALTE